jgi:hypothetical protein
MDTLSIVLSLTHIQDREREFMNMAHQWMHTKMMKRAGRFVKPGGSNGTVDGELAVLCRSCPSPKINLPVNWRLSDRL